MGNTQSVSIPFLFLFFFTSHPYILSKYLQNVFYLLVECIFTCLAFVVAITMLCNPFCPSDDDRERSSKVELFGDQEITFM